MGSTFARSEAKEESIVLGLTNSSSSPAMPKVLPTDQAPPAAHSGWQDRNSQFIVAVEKHLAAFLGPIAGIVTRRAASQAKDPAELFTLLAAMLHTERDRYAFLDHKDELLRRFPRTQQIETASSKGPAVSTPAQPAPAGSRAELTPGATRRASELLAQHLGPVSKVLVERAAPRADSLRALYALLAEHLHDRAERSQFLAEAGFPE